MNRDAVADIPARSSIDATRRRLVIWIDRLAVWSVIGLAAIMPFANTGRLRSTLLAMGIAGWLLRWYFERTSRWTQTRVDIPLALFVAWGIVGLLNAVDVAYSVREVKNELVTHAVLFGLSASLARREADVRNLIRAVLIAALLMGAYAVWQFDWQYTRNLLYTLRWNRSSSFAPDPIFLSSYLILVAPLVLYMALNEQARWSRAGSWSVLVVLLLAVVASGTRAAWVAVASQSLVYGALRSRRLVAVVVLLVAILIGLQILWPPFRDWTSDGYRFALWRQLLPYAAEAPLTGYGYGPETPPRVLSSVYDRIPFDKNHTFNTFLNVALELGLVGLALFVFVLWRVATSLWSGLNRALDPATKTFFLCLLMVLVGFLLRNQFDHLFRESPAHLFWILMGLGVGRAVALGIDRPRAPS